MINLRVQILILFFFLVSLGLISISAAPYFVSAAGEYADGALIRAEEDDKVYYLEDGKKRWVDSIESFQAHNFDWDKVMVVSQAEAGAYELGQALTLESSIKEISAQADTAAPNISKIKAAEITETTAVITWLTDEPTDSKINYGLVSPLTTASTTLDSNKATSHRLDLINLKTSAIYYYAVISTDKKGNTAISPERSFTTQPLSLAEESQNWPNVRITDASGQASFPSMVWTGQEYGIVWSDSRQAKESEIYFALLNGNGIKIGKDIKISNQPNKISSQPALVWTGQEYGIVWSEYSRQSEENAQGCYLYFARLDADGLKQGVNMLVTSDNYGTCPGEPAIVWTGSQYGISWHESRLGNATSRIFFTRLNQLGEKQGEDIKISEKAISEDSSIAWSGNEFGLVWKRGGSGSKIYFARLDIDGVKQDKDIKVNNTGGASLSPAIAWIGSHYSVIWQGQDGNNERQIYLTKLDQNGSKQSDDLALTSNSVGDYSIYPSFVWTGQEYGVVWQQGEGTIYFIRLDKNENKKTGAQQISSAFQGQAKHPVIAWNGTENKYGIIWDDTRDNSGEIYFAASAASLTDLSAPNGNTYLASVWDNRPIVITFFLIISFLGILAFWFIYLRNRPSGQ